MEMIYVLICVLCLGVLLFTTVKNEKLIKETHSAKKEYLYAKSNNVKLESNFQEAMTLFKETRHINELLVTDMGKCMSELRDLRFTVHQQSGLIEELNERVTTLEYDNRRLKQKLNIHDEISKRSKVISPFKATI